MKSYKKVQSNVRSCRVSGHKTVLVEERMKSYKQVQSNTRSCRVSAGHKTVLVEEKMKSYKRKFSLILEVAELVDTKLS